MKQVTNKVYVIECFGYGYSSNMDKEHTIENITDEIHQIITKLEIDEPYTMICHSISGIYGLYYANQYSDELKAFVGIDNSVPHQLEYQPFSERNQFEFLLRTSGFLRIFTKIDPNMIIPQEKHTRNVKPNSFNDNLEF